MGRVERAELAASENSCFGRPGSIECAFCHRDDCIDLGIDSRDPIQVSLDDLDGRDLFGADEFGQSGGIEIGQIRGHVKLLLHT
jgi:hypothetical protein